MGDLIALSKQEELRRTAPARPAARDRDVIVAAYARYAPEFRQATGAHEPEHDAQLIENLVEALKERDPWQASKRLAFKGWPMDADLYNLFLGFIRHLETARIEAEVEWVMRFGIRFPARQGQRIAFVNKLTRHTGVVEYVDGPRARAIVRKPKATGGEAYSVTSDQVQMVFSDTVGGQDE